MSKRLRISAGLLLVMAVTCDSLAASIVAAAPLTAGTAGGALPAGEVLQDEDRVSATGAYQTQFDIPVPSAPAAPVVALTYDSGSGREPRWLGLGPLGGMAHGHHPRPAVRHARVDTRRGLGLGR